MGATPWEGQRVSAEELGYWQEEADKGPPPKRG